MHTSSLTARLTRAVAVIGLAVAAACAPDAPSVVAPPPSDANLIAVGRPDDLGLARAAQVRHTGRLLGNRDILGTGIGRLSDGRPGITVYARNAAAAARLHVPVLRPDFPENDLLFPDAFHLSRTAAPQFTRALAEEWRAARAGAGQ